MKSAREIANMASTNRQAVYRYLSKHHIKESTLDETGKRLYEDKTALGVVKALSKRKPRAGATVAYKTLKEQLNIKDEQIKTMSNTLKLLNGTIQQLNSQIALNKNNRIASDQKQTKLLDANSKIKDENIRLKTQIEQYKRDAQKANEQLEKMQKASLWQRITRNWSN